MDLDGDRLRAGRRTGRESAKVLVSGTRSFTAPKRLMSDQFSELRVRAVDIARPRSRALRRAMGTERGGELRRP